MENKTMTDKEIKDFMYQPNSEPKAAYLARVRSLDLETLKRALKVASLSKADYRQVSQMVSEKTPTESTDDPHPDGWYDR